MDGVVPFPLASLDEVYTLFVNAHGEPVRKRLRDMVAGEPWLALAWLCEESNGLLRGPDAEAARAVGDRHDRLEAAIEARERSAIRVYRPREGHMSVDVRDEPDEGRRRLKERALAIVVWWDEGRVEEERLPIASLVSFVGEMVVWADVDEDGAADLEICPLVRFEEEYGWSGGGWGRR